VEDVEVVSAGGQLDMEIGKQPFRAIRGVAWLQRNELAAA
jgi:hypothetical protein